MVRDLSCLYADMVNRRCNCFAAIDNRASKQHSSPPFDRQNLELALANSAQAKKRARQSETRRKHNTSRRSFLRTRIKQVLQAIEGGDKSLAENAYKIAVPVLDRMARGDIIDKNKAARHKSRLFARIKAMS